MAVFNKDKKNVFKDISANKDFVENTETHISSPKKTRGRSKIANKRDKTYTFYCTQDELNLLEKLASEKHLTMAEYFRIKLFT